MITRAQYADVRIIITPAAIRIELADDPSWTRAATTQSETIAAITAAVDAQKQINQNRNRVRLLDLDGHDPDGLRIPSPAAKGPRRVDVYDPRTWRVDPDQQGIWISPRGFRYPEDRQVVQRVMDAREAMGLPRRPGAGDPIPISRTLLPHRRHRPAARLHPAPGEPA